MQFKKHFPKSAFKEDTKVVGLHNVCDSKTTVLVQSRKWRWEVHQTIHWEFSRQLVKAIITSKIKDYI